MKLIGDVYEIAYTKAVDDHKEQLQKAGLVAIGIVNGKKKYDNEEKEYHMKFEIPHLLSILGYRNAVMLGAILMAIGEFIIIGGSEQFLMIGMGALIVGNGYFKANISTIVGKLDDLIKNHNYKYHHYPNKIDGSRDRNGIWIHSDIVFSNQQIDYEEEDNMIFYVFYNHLLCSIKYSCSVINSV